MASLTSKTSRSGAREQFALLERVHYRKLSGGKWFANLALALAMMYFRLKEIL